MVKVGCNAKGGGGNSEEGPVTSKAAVKKPWVKVG